MSESRGADSLPRLARDWHRVPLHEVAEVRTGLAVGKTDLRDPVEVPYLRVANVQNGRLNLAVVKRILVERNQVARYSLHRGDILMTEGGDFDKLGRGDVWNGQIDPCLHQNHVFAVRPKPNLVDSYFLAAQAASEQGRLYFLSCAKRSTNLASINSSQLKKFPVLLPPLMEQQKIARILACWDEAIVATERLLARSKGQRKALTQQLLTGRNRLSPFSEKWKSIRFDQVFSRVRRKNTIGNDTVLTISGRLGLVSQRDFFNKNVASDNLTTYTLVRRGEFAYNKSYSAGYPYGAIKPLERYEEAVVSSLYLCFAFKTPDEHCHDFFRHYFEAGCFNREIYATAQEGARNHGLLNVSAVDFFNARLLIPERSEQKAIADAINLAARESQNLENQRDVLCAQKKALMQKLLTGKHRVTLDSAA